KDLVAGRIVIIDRPTGRPQVQGRQGKRGQRPVFEPLEPWPVVESVTPSRFAGLPCKPTFQEIHCPRLHCYSYLKRVFQLFGRTGPSRDQGAELGAGPAPRAYSVLAFPPAIKPDAG